MILQAAQASDALIRIRSMKLSFTTLKYLVGNLETGILVSRFIRLLKSSKEEDSLRDEEPQPNCKKCGVRPAADSDGLCDQCRFDDVLAELVKKK